MPTRYSHVLKSRRLTPNSTKAAAQSPRQKCPAEDGGILKTRFAMMRQELKALMSLLQQIDHVSIAIKPTRRCVPFDLAHPSPHHTLPLSFSAPLPSHSLSLNLSIASKPQSEPLSRSTASNIIDSEGIRSTIKSRVVDLKSHHLLPSAPLHQGNKNKTYLYYLLTSITFQPLTYRSATLCLACKSSMSEPLRTNLPPDLGKTKSHSVHPVRT
jgi:hypothetical protein